ncbi:MAG: alpha/beta hydrolase fold domain-containing protein [Pirellulales bacterium]|nr:alpha/beta hydrolase fold domain-containing protein [Pirellulales bacterium]
MMKWFWGHYLPSPNDGVHPDALPFLAKDFSGLPAATIITAEVDPLRREGEAYAEKLKAAGVAVDYKNVDGVTHEFFGMGAVVDKAKESVAHVGDNLTAHFAGRSAVREQKSKPR